jgi:hypothetical protein
LSLCRVRDKRVGFFNINNDIKMLRILI